jgi:hypothetical protein
MDDVDRVEAVSGELGMPGCKYRLVPKTGNRVFVAMLTARNLPAEAHLNLEASNVTVSVKGTFVGISSDKTRLRSEEVFSFKGLLNKIVGLLAQRSIKRAHRRHMEAFKRFAEAHRGEPRTAAWRIVAGDAPASSGAP